MAWPEKNQRVVLEFHPTLNAWFCRTDIHHPNLMLNVPICQCLISGSSIANAEVILQQLLSLPQRSCSGCIKNRQSLQEYQLHPIAASLQSAWSISRSVSLKEQLDTIIVTLSRETLLRTGAFSDLRISVDSKAFRCHSPILSTSGTHLASLCGSGVHRVENMTPAMFARLLQFIYLDDLGNATHISLSGKIELVKAALDFGVTSLAKIFIHHLVCKQTCSFSSLIVSQAMSANASNICELALAAVELLESPMLLWMALKFMVPRFNEVVRSPSWMRFKDCSKLQSLLAGHVVKSCARRELDIHCNNSKKMMRTRCRSRLA